MSPAKRLAAALTARGAHVAAHIVTNGWKGTTFAAIGATSVACCTNYAQGQILGAAFGSWRAGEDDIVDNLLDLLDLLDLTVPPSEGDETMPRGAR